MVPFFLQIPPYLRKLKEHDAEFAELAWGLFFSAGPSKLESQRDLNILLITFVG